MLNREENEIMRAVYELCGGKGCCLVSPYDLMSLLPAKRGYTAERVDRLLRSLELDDYFDLLESDRKGERPRERLQMRRSIAFKIGLSVAGAVITFLVGLLLRLAFS